MPVQTTNFAELIAEQQRRAIEDDLYWTMAEGELIEIDDPATRGRVELFPDYGDNITLTGRLITGAPFNQNTMVYWKPQVREPLLDPDGNAVEGLPAIEGERVLVFWPNRQSEPYLMLGVRDGVHQTGAEIVAGHLAKYGLVEPDGSAIGAPIAYAVSSAQPRDGQSQHIFFAVSGGGKESYLKVTQDNLKASQRTEGRGGLGVGDIQAEQGAFLEMPVLVPHPNALKYDEDSQSDYAEVSGGRVYLNTGDRRFGVKSIRVSISGVNTYEVNPHVSEDNGTYTVSPDFTGGEVVVPTSATTVTVRLSLNERQLEPADIGGDSVLLGDVGFQRLRNLLSQAKIRLVEPDDNTPSSQLTPTSGIEYPTGLPRGVNLVSGATRHRIRFLIIRDEHIVNRYTLVIEQR